MLGVGGIFFRSSDPERLMDWYRRWLGFPPSPDGSVSFHPQPMPENDLTVRSPFPEVRAPIY